MRSYIACSIILLAPSIVLAQPYETIEQARQRQSADNYTTYRQNNNQAPLGGYNEKLGDPSPMGTDRPGMINSYPGTASRDPLDDRLPRR